MAPIIQPVRVQLQALSRYLSNVTVLLCSKNVVTATLPANTRRGEKRAFNILRMPLADCGRTLRGSFFHWVESKPVNLLWTFDVQISEDCGVLYCCVSPMKVTKSCNQSLFTIDPSLYFHNLSTSLSVSLSYQSVSVM